MSVMRLCGGGLLWVVVYVTTASAATVYILKNHKTHYCINKPLFLGQPQRTALNKHCILCLVSCLEKNVPCPVSCLWEKNSRIIVRELIEVEWSSLRQMKVCTFVHVKKSPKIFFQKIIFSFFLTGTRAYVQ